MTVRPQNANKNYSSGMHIKTSKEIDQQKKKQNKTECG